MTLYEEMQAIISAGEEELLAQHKDDPAALREICDAVEDLRIWSAVLYGPDGADRS